MTIDLRAEEIAEDLLYRTSKALISNCCDRVGACFEYPQVLETIAGKLLVESEDDIFKMYARVRSYFEANGVRDIVRTVVSAEFLSPTMVGSTHVSQLLLEDGTPFRAPYPSYSILRESGGVWRVASTMSAILDAPEHNVALSGRGGNGEAESGNLTPSEGNGGRHRP